MALGMGARRRRGGWGGVDRKRPLWHAELGPVEEGEAPEWIRVGRNHI